MQSSQIVSDVAQADGSRSVIELHILDDGRRVLVNYTAAKGLDAVAYMQARAPQIEAQDADEKARVIARALFKSMTNKTQNYLGGFTNPALVSQVGLTAGEIAVFRATS